VGLCVPDPQMQTASADAGYKSYMLPADLKSKLENKSFECDRYNTA